MGMEQGSYLEYAPYEQSWEIESPKLPAIETIDLPDLPMFPTDPWAVTPDWGDPFADFQDYWQDLDFDWLEPPIEVIPTVEQGAPVQLPNVGNWPIPDQVADQVWLADGFGLPPLEDAFEGPPFGLPPPPCFGITPTGAVPACGPVQQNNPANPCECIPRLPPACPQGTYHPYPIGHPQQDECAPLPLPPPPPPPPPKQQQQQVPLPPVPPPKQQQQQVPLPPVPPPKQQQQPKQPSCPPGYWPNPATRRCERSTQCVPPDVIDPATGQCVTPSQLPPPGDATENNWWLWALLAGVGVLAVSGSDEPRRRRR